MTVPLAPLPGITGREVADWTKSRLGDALPAGAAIIGPGEAYTSTGALIGSPDRLGVVSRTGGPGLQYEGIFDAVTFQARTRGAQNDYDDAERFALLVDAAFIDAKLPLQIGTHQVPRIDRVGGAPAFLLRDPAGRSHFTCNYVVFASR